MPDEEPSSVIALEGNYNSTCGYCSQSGSCSSLETSHSFGAWPLQLSCGVYQKMVDRGWRRSGTFVYKPDLKISCCPQYTIRLDALEFSPSRSQRQTTNRFNRFVINGLPEENIVNPTRAKEKPPPFELLAALYSSEASFLPQGTTAKHKLEIILEPASFTEEKFALYRHYQESVHKDLNKQRSSFERFLVDTCLLMSPIAYPAPPPSHLPQRYGTHHQLYRIDGELIAMGVLDILPNCVSSVYFMYLEKWGWCSLGKISALREVALAREIHAAGITSMKWLYMGFYIYSCPKMKYKGAYSPSFLLDPVSYTWYPLGVCIPLLSNYRYAVFSDPARSSNDQPLSHQRSETDPLNISSDVLDNTLIVKSKKGGNITVVPAQRSKQWSNPRTRREILEGVNALGHELAQEVVLSI